MTHHTNQRLIELMEDHGLDTRPDPRTNKDAEYIGGLLGVTRAAVIGWIAPEGWKKYREMPSGYLELLEIKLKK